MHQGLTLPQYTELHSQAETEGLINKVSINDLDLDQEQSKQVRLSIALNTAIQDINVIKKFEQYFMNIRIYN